MENGGTLANVSGASKRLLSLGLSAVAAALAIVLGAQDGFTTSAAFAGPGFECHEIDAYVDYRGVTIDPPAPRVGDQVRIAFDVNLFVYSSGPSTLIGTEPFLTGTTMVTGGYNPSFLFTAAQAGTVTFHLSITYLTEEACQDDAGNTFFTVGSYHDVTLPSFTLEIAGGETCSGDCNASGSVTVEEIVRGIRIVLGEEAVDMCPVLDRDGDGAVNVDDVLAAVAAALNGCR